MTTHPGHGLSVVPVPGHGTEDVLVDRDGSVLTGTEDGTVWRVRGDGLRIVRVGNTGGRPMGLELLPDGGLRFSNGVTLAADESFVAVAETGGRAVVRLWLTGDRAGRRDHLVADLPGYPDNIARGSDGLVWVTVASPPGIPSWRR